MRLFSQVSSQVRRKVPHLFERGSYQRESRVMMFDADGVLFRTDITAAHAIRQTAVVLKMKPIPTFADARLRAVDFLRRGRSAREAYAEMYPVEAQDEKWLNKAVRIFVEAYQEFDVEHTQLYPEVKETLEALCEQDKQLFVVSKKDADQLEETLNRLGIKDCFVELYGDRPGEIHKPNPLIFNEKILPRYHDVKREEVLMVGDSLSADGIFAKNCDVPFCWAAYGYGQEGESDCPIDFSINNFSDLKCCLSSSVIKTP